MCGHASMEEGDGYETPIAEGFAAAIPKLPRCELQYERALERIRNKSGAVVLSGRNTVKSRTAGLSPPVPGTFSQF
jgi:hypothetical protein